MKDAVVYLSVLILTLWLPCGILATDDPYVRGKRQGPPGGHGRGPPGGGFGGPGNPGRGPPGGGSGRPGGPGHGPPGNGFGGPGGPEKGQIVGSQFGSPVGNFGAGHPGGGHQGGGHLGGGHEGGGPPDGGHQGGGHSGGGHEGGGPPGGGHQGGGPPGGGHQGGGHEGGRPPDGGHQGGGPPGGGPPGGRDPPGEKGHPGHPNEPPNHNSSPGPGPGGPGFGGHGDPPGSPSHGGFPGQSQPDQDPPKPPGDEVPSGQNNEQLTNTPGSTPIVSNTTRCEDRDFTCGSGECFPSLVRCDNVQNCQDGSDEFNCKEVATTTAPAEEASATVTGCTLPEVPEGGSYELGGCTNPCRKVPGDKVPKNSILTFTCDSGYTLQGNTISFCLNQEWYKPPVCLKTCPPLKSTSVDITCTYQGSIVPCEGAILPDTKATLACRSSYKISLYEDPAYRELTCLKDGIWDRPLFRCLPECGTAVAHGNTLIVNGFTAKVSVFPWHVGIYEKAQNGNYEQICAGTLISNNLVISAAHCFYDESNGEPKDASNYAVAAGKQNRSWAAVENYVQKSNIEKIELPSRYMGARGNFALDISILKLSTPFVLTALVRPICLDWDNKYEREQLQVGQSGKAVGWGKTGSGLPSEDLQEINLPFIPFHECLSTVPNDFRPFITSDKFCAGYLNGSSLCEGDSGGGLCFEMQGIWYLRGIVSVSPVKDNSCDYNSYTGFTYISHFRDWIRSAYVSS